MAAVYAPPTIITTAADGRSRRASPLPSPVHSPSASASPPAANNASSSSSYSSSSAAATTNSSPFPFNAAPGFSAVRRSLRRKPAPAPVPPPAAPLPPPPPSQAIRPARYPASPIPTTPTSAGAISLGDDASPERVVRSLDLASGADGSGSGSSSGSGGGAGGSDDYSSLSSASASYGYYDGGYGNAASSPAQNGAAVGGADSIAARPLAPSSPSRASAPPSRPVVAAVHARLASEPASRRPPPAAAAVRLHLRFRSVSLAPKPDMAKPIARKPAPILVDAPPKQQSTKLSSFFAWKPTTPSPGPPDSAMTDASFDGAASPANAAASSAPTSFIDSYPSSLPKTPRTPQRAPPTPVLDPDLHARLADLEHGVRDVSAELAASVRREMELEELLDRMPDAAAAVAAATADRRTSDYFSDTPSDPGADRDRDRSKPDLDVNRLRRAAEQERALLKAELSQKWQDERARRQASEAHVQILESQVNAFRAERVDVSNLSARARELDVALEDTRRRLTEERTQKENFEDLLTGMRVDLEQHRNERDRLQAELKIALAAGSAAGGRVKAIAEEGTNANSSFGGGALSRSNSLARASPKRSSDGLSRSGSLTRSTSVLSKDREPRESSGDRLKDLEIQRDLLHQTVKNLLVRQKQAAAQSAKDLSLLTRELDRERVGSPRRRGYERDVRSLREEVNLLRRRADDALVTKWQCEKGLAGVKIDLDRAEMETSSLRALLNEQRSSTGSGASSSGDDTDNFHLSALSLEEAYNRNHADASEDDLSIQIRDQVATNRTLLSRLSAAVGRGEVEQRDSATRITELQSRLRFLEDALVMAQQVSEEEVSKHEAEVHFLRDAHNAQLQRIRAGQRSAGAAAAASPGGSTIATGSPLITTVTAGQSPTLSPGNSTPRPGGAVAAAAVALTPKLDVTTSGMGIPLTRAVQTEDMEKKVRELEAALREADREMAEVVGRVNESQIEVAELQMERDAALRETKRLKKQMR